MTNAIRYQELAQLLRNKAEEIRLQTVEGVRSFAGHATSGPRMSKAAKADFCADDWKLVDLVKRASEFDTPVYFLELTDAQKNVIGTVFIVRDAKVAQKFRKAAGKLVSPHAK